MLKLDDEAADDGESSSMQLLSDDQNNMWVQEVGIEN